MAPKLKNQARPLSSSAKPFEGNAAYKTFFGDFRAIIGRKVMGLAALAYVAGCSMDMSHQYSSDAVSQSDTAPKSDTAPTYVEKASPLSIEEAEALQEAVAPLWANPGADKPNVFEVSPGVVVVTFIDIEASGIGIPKYVFGKASEEKTIIEDLKSKTLSDAKTLEFTGFFEGVKVSSTGIYKDAADENKVLIDTGGVDGGADIEIDVENELLVYPGTGLVELYPEYGIDSFSSISIYKSGSGSFHFRYKGSSKAVDYDFSTGAETLIDATDVSANDDLYCTPGHQSSVPGGITIQSVYKGNTVDGDPKCEPEIAYSFEEMDDNILLPPSIIAIKNSSHRITSPRFIPGGPGKGGLIFVKDVLVDGKYQPQIMISHVEMPAGPECGNGDCEPGETPGTCPADCETEAVCGDTVCEPAKGENLVTCEDDCYECGDGTCSTADEDYTNCPEDCEKPVKCGDEVCEPDKGETKENCGEDCDDCGDGTCGTSEDKE
ncbi:hypothetical protein JKY72_07140, partial [Candidatus Gracilibacteria bacterium]|nr:hypothetical protein [Candidatus Gracilibacteria bacterium]